MKYPKLDRFMRKIFLALIISFSFFLSLDAQITVVMDVPIDAAPCNGEEVCVDVRVKDFSNVTNMRYDITWDADVFTLAPNGIKNFNALVTGLGAGNFDLSQVANGRISLNWSLADCSDDTASGITLDDCNGQCLPSIFQLCFISGSSYGAVSEVTVPLTPTPYVTKDNSRCNNVFLTPVPGLLSTCVRPVQIYATDEFAEEGDRSVCVEIKANGFDRLTSMQFTIQWDNAILDFASVSPNSNEIPSLSIGSFGLPDEANVPDNRMTFSWSYVPTSNPGWDLPDGTTLFSVCFDIIGDCESSSLIEIIDEEAPFNVEVTNVVEEGFVIYTSRAPGSITVESCDPTGLVIRADCDAEKPSYDPGDEFCVPVTTEGFINIREMAFLTRWNPLILEFTGLANINTNIPGFDINSFDITNVANGFVGIDYTAAAPIGVSITGGTGKLFDICFKVVGLGSNSPIQFPRTPARVFQRNTSIGINPQNCEVMINQPPGVSFNPDPVSQRLNETICIDFEVNNFQDVSRMVLHPAWDPSKLEFVEVINVNLPEPDKAVFNTATAPAGIIALNYNPSIPQSFPEGEVAFTMCFRVLADPGDCDIVSLENIPGLFESVSYNASAPDQPQEVTFPGSEICSLFPEGFFLKIDSTEGDWLDSVCVDVKVSSFDNISETSFNLTWDPTNLQFQRIEIPGALDGLTESSFNTGSTDVGSLGINWVNPNSEDPNLADETTIFSVCFGLDGVPDECHPVSLANSPEPVVRTTRPMFDGEASVLSEDGAVCINNRIIVISTEVTPVSCPDATDGTAKITVIGGRQPIGFNWDLPTPRFGPEVNNLPPGPVTVTIFDDSRPNSIILEETIIIPVTDIVPEANAGPDLIFNCNDDIIAIEGSGSPLADGYSVRWRTIGGSLPQTRDRYQLMAQAAGDYILEVTRSATGCIARDTVTVRSPEAPVASAGPDLELNCDSDFVTIDGSGSSVGDTVSYQWTMLRGGEIAEGEDTIASPRIFLDGTYILTVQYTTNGCVDTDTVRVRDNRIYPEAAGGNVYELPCDGTNVVLDGSNSDNEAPVTYEWLNFDGSPLAQGLTATVTDLGEYIFQATFNETNCSSRDTVSVIPTTTFPIVDAGEAPEFSCNSDTVSLQGTVREVFNYTAQWTALDPQSGIVPGLENELTTQALGPGRYELMVTYNLNNCSTRDTVEVIDLTTPPQAEAGPDGTITCDNTTYSLDGTGSANAGNLRYAWRLGDLIVAEDALQITVDIPGTYYLAVTDTITGCVGIDSVQVINDGSQPTVQIANPGEFDCGVGFLSLNATITPQANYDIRWVKLDGIGRIVEGATSPTAVVDGPGSYQINVTNIDNGCAGSNVIVVGGDVEKPVAEAGMDLVLDCDVDTLTLTGTVTGGGDTLTYSWQGFNGGAIIPGSQDGLSAQAALPGTYVFRATNPLSGCFSVDTLRVTENRVFPVAEAGEGTTLTCEDNTFTLNGTGSSTGSQYTYLWITNGRIIAKDTLQFTIGSPGTYYFAVRDTTNGCVSSDSTLIEITDDLPEIRFLAEVPNITCYTDTVTIEPTVFPEDASYRFQWTTADGRIISSDTELAATVTSEGTYNILVTNTLTGCMTMDSIFIDSDTLRPVANAGPDLSIDCRSDSVLINGDGSNGPTYRFQWTAEDGGTIRGTDIGRAIVGATPGRYILTVTDLANGCTTTSEMEVINDANAPVINFNNPGALDCNNETVTIDATQSVAGNNITSTWTPLAGGATQTGLTLQVSSPGSFELHIFDNDTGCEARDTITIIQDQNEPVANAGSDITVQCTGTPIPLSGAGSSTGDTIAYQWSAVSGGGPVTDATTLNPTVTEAGTYQLLVTNTVNGCTATDQVMVSQENDLPQAAAGDDDSTCENSFTLSAVPPQGALGVWSGPAGITIDSPSDATTFVSNLSPGPNVFTWTLSSVECPNYSSDQVVINVAQTPAANNDGATVVSTDSVVTVNVLSNDQVDGAVTVTIVTQPTQGSVTAAGGNGVFRYQKQAGATGSDSFTYEVCSVECPDLCSTATVTITIQSGSDNPQVDKDLPMNAITPNGDGRNDELVFDILLQGASKFPNNELIIFNRWGDIIYQASPYNNDWRGTNNTGQELPDGTYYYILRLDIGEGEILKGDITILK